jgi:hypothetical protein
MTQLVPVTPTPRELVPYGIPNAPVLSPKQMRKLARRFAADLERRGKTGQLVVWRSSCVRAYFYRGRWVGDCPVPECKNAEYLTVEPLFANRYTAESRWDRKDYFICSNLQCGTVTQSIVFPQDAGEIEDVLNRRPMALTRNWYPAGHITAVSHGIEDGQTVAELIQENVDHGVV